MEQQGQRCGASGKSENVLDCLQPHSHLRQDPALEPSIATLHSFFVPLCLPRQGKRDVDSLAQECLFSDWVSSYLLSHYQSPKASGFTEMHAVGLMINASWAAGQDASPSQTAHCSPARHSPSLSHADHGFPKRSIYVLSAALRGLQGLMGCERGLGFFILFSAVQTPHALPFHSGSKFRLPR